MAITTTTSHDFQQQQQQQQQQSIPSFQSTTGRPASVPVGRSQSYFPAGVRMATAYETPHSKLQAKLNERLNRLTNQLSQAYGDTVSSTNAPVASAPATAAGGYSHIGDAKLLLNHHFNASFDLTNITTATAEVMGNPTVTGSTTAIMHQQQYRRSIATSSIVPVPVPSKGSLSGGTFVTPNLYSNSNSLSNPTGAISGSSAFHDFRGPEAVAALRVRAHDWLNRQEDNFMRLGRSQREELISQEMAIMEQQWKGYKALKKSFYDKRNKIVRSRLTRALSLEMEARKLDEWRPSKVLQIVRRDWKREDEERMRLIQEEIAQSLAMQMHMRGPAAMANEKTMSSNESDGLERSDADGGSDDDGSVLSEDDKFIFGEIEETFNTLQRESVNYEPAMRTRRRLSVVATSNGDPKDPSNTTVQQTNLSVWQLRAFTQNKYNLKPKTIPEWADNYEKDCIELGVTPSASVLKQLSQTGPSRLTRSRSNSPVSTPLSSMPSCCDLRYAGLDSTKALALARHLSDCSMLTALDLANNDLDHTCIHELVQAVCKSKHILHLDFSNNPRIGLMGIEDIAVALNPNNPVNYMPIRTLVLDNVGMGNRGLSELVANMRDNDSISMLSIARNDIDDEGAEAIAEIIEENIACFVKMDISWNSIRSDGAKLIADALQTNSTLQELKCSWNGFGCAGGKSFGNMLMSNKSLKVLDMSKTGIDSKACDAISNGILKNKTLEKFLLDGNHIDQNGARLLMRSREVNKTLKYLGLYHCILKQTVQGKSVAAQSNSAPSGKESKSGAGSDITTTKQGDNNVLVIVDKKRPEGRYRFDLSKQEDRDLAIALCDADPSVRISINKKLTSLLHLQLKSKPSTADSTNSSVPHEGFMDLSFSGNWSPSSSAKSASEISFMAILDELSDVRLSDIDKLDLIKLYYATSQSSYGSITSEQCRKLLLTFSNVKTYRECCEAAAILFYRLIDVWTFDDTVINFLPKHARSLVCSELGLDSVFVSDYPTGHYRLNLEKQMDRYILAKLIAFTSKTVRASSLVHSAMNFSSAAMEKMKKNVDWRAIWRNVHYSSNGKDNNSSAVFDLEGVMHGEMVPVPLVGKLSFDFVFTKNTFWDVNELKRPEQNKNSKESSVLSMAFKPKKLSENQYVKRSMAASAIAVAATTFMANSVPTSHSNVHVWHGNNPNKLHEFIVSSFFGVNDKKKVRCFRHEDLATFKTLLGGAEAGIEARHSNASSASICCEDIIRLTRITTASDLIVELVVTSFGAVSDGGSNFFKVLYSLKTMEQAAVIKRIGFESLFSYCLSHEREGDEDAQFIDRLSMHYVVDLKNEEDIHMMGILIQKLDVLATAHNDIIRNLIVNGELVPKTDIVSYVQKIKSIVLSSNDTKSLQGDAHDIRVVEFDFFGQDIFEAMDLCGFLCIQCKHNNNNPSKEQDTVESINAVSADDSHNVGDEIAKEDSASDQDHSGQSDNCHELQRFESFLLWERAVCTIPFFKLYNADAGVDSSNINPSPEANTNNASVEKPKKGKKASGKKSKGKMKESKDELTILKQWFEEDILNEVESKANPSDRSRLSKGFDQQEIQGFMNELNEANFTSESKHKWIPPYQLSYDSFCMRSCVMKDVVESVQSQSTNDASGAGETHPNIAVKATDPMRWLFLQSSRETTSFPLILSKVCQVAGLQNTRLDVLQNPFNGDEHGNPNSMGLHPQARESIPETAIDIDAFTAMNVLMYKMYVFLRIKMMIEKSTTGTGSSGSADMS